MKKPFNIIMLISRLKNKADISGIHKLRKIYIRIVSSMRSKAGYSDIKQTDTVMDNFLLTLSSGKRALVLLSFLMISVLSVNAQDSLRVKGVIVSGSNEPVPNVQVSVEGSFAMPVLTNIKGEFEVKATADNWLLIKPSSQYKAKRIFVNRRSEIKIYLTSDDMVSGDDEIEMLGQTKVTRDIVSSYSELDLSTVGHGNALSIDQHMEGRIPGMYVVNRSGDPGSGAVTLLRGVNSLNASNDPLYIVDGIITTPHSLFGSNLSGFEYNPLLNVSPADVSKVTVVKDPALTASYGSQASNGLVLIQTLDPSSTKTSFDIDVRSGYSLAPSNQIPQLNADQHKTLINEVLFSSGKFGEDLRVEYPNLYLIPSNQRFIDYQHNTNWQDLIFRNSTFNNINVKVKGGDQIARYGLSVGYVNSNGIIQNTSYQGYNLRFVSLLDIFSWLNMNAGVSLNYNTSQLKESALDQQTSPILSALAKSPMLNPYKYDLQGNQIDVLSPVDELGVSNPEAIIRNFEGNDDNYDFIANLGFEVTLNKELYFKTNFGYTYNLLKEQIFQPSQGMELYYNGEAWNVAKSAYDSYIALNSTSYIKYHKSFGTAQVLTSTTGLNILANDFQYDWALTKNSPQNDQYKFIQDGTDNLREIGGQNRKWDWVSLYENATYSFKDKYMLTGSVSLDGSSRIGKLAPNTLKIGDNPFGVFYAGGVAWRLSGERFLRKLSWLDDLKLRLTYGKTGNDDVGESNAKKYYENIRYRETAGLYPAILPDSALTYESVAQLNFGIDLAVVGNRLRASFDVFNSKTNNMLIYVPVESYLGYSYRPDNGGKLQNKGWEANLFARIIDGRSFKWDLQGNVSTSSNKILELTGNKIVTDINGGQIVNMIGQPANSFYGYVFEGVYSTQAEAAAAGLVNDKNFAYSAGDAIYKDISGPDGKPDGVINEYDKTIIGSATPKYYGGLLNSFTFKRWTLTGFLQFVTGNNVFNYLRYEDEQMTGLANQSTRVLSRWQYEGQVTDVPRALWNDPMGNSSFSTRWIENGSYLRVKNITLSYKIPNEFLAFQNGEFYISANDIFTVTKYLGYDPEFAYSYSQVGQGVDYGMTPQPRQFIIGIKLGL